jgi:hydroxyacylglutathione hydrolase
MSLRLPGDQSIDGEPTGRALPRPSLASPAFALPATPFLVDVRTPPEFNQGRIDGAINVPLNRLRDHLGSLPAGRDVVVYCASGYRSAIAASLMLVTRFRAVTDLASGLAAWEAARLPVT